MQFPFRRTVYKYAVPSRSSDYFISSSRTHSCDKFEQIRLADSPPYSTVNPTEKENSKTLDKYGVKRMK